jgi:hypothetical protein
MRLLLLPLLLLPFMLAGCSLLSDSEPSSEQLSLHTDQTIYIAQQERGGSHPSYGFQVVTRFVNLTTRTVYLARCYPDSPYPLYSVELVDPEDEWGAAYNGAWACVGHENPIAVAPGSTRTDTLHLTGPNFWSWDGQHDGVLEGRFRLRYRAKSCRAEIGCELPGDVARSNTFEVTRSH